MTCRSLGQTRESTRGHQGPPKATVGSRTLPTAGLVSTCSAAVTPSRRGFTRRAHGRGLPLPTGHRALPAQSCLSAMLARGARLSAASPRAPSLLRAGLVPSLCAHRLSPAGCVTSPVGCAHIVMLCYVTLSPVGCAHVVMLCYVTLSPRRTCEACRSACRTCGIGAAEQGRLDAYCSVTPSSSVER